MSFPFRSIIEQNDVNPEIKFLVDYCDKKRIELANSERADNTLNIAHRPFFMLPNMTDAIHKIGQHNDSRFELSMNQLIQLRSALTNLGIAAPESMEELGFNQNSYIMKMIRTVNNIGNN